MKWMILAVFCAAIGGCAATPLAPVPGKTDLRAQLDRADRALREARLLDAEILYRNLTREHPALPDVWLRLGNIYARQSQNLAAVRAYKEGLRYRPHDGRIWYNLAVVQLKQAVETLESASAVLPPDAAYLPRIRRLHRTMLSANTSDADASGR